MPQPVPDPPITVLLSLSPPDGTTRYVDQVVSAAPSNISFVFFSWRFALTGAYDVLHVHWPELMVRARGPVKAMARRRALDALVLRARLTRRPIVRTVHNVRPHDAATPAENRSLDRLDRATSVAIQLNPVTESPARSRPTLIPHGHYRDRFAEYAQHDAVVGRLLFFGLVRPYKGVDRLIDAFSSLLRPDLRLRIVGRPSGGLRDVVDSAVATNPRISALLEFVSDPTLVEEVTCAEIVVLPYREMNNSGALLVALSLDRPVVVPSTASNRALAAEVGPGWLYLFDGPMTRAVLDSAVTSIRSTARSSRPDLTGREWDEIGRRTAQVYRDAVTTARTGRPVIR